MLAKAHLLHAQYFWLEVSDHTIVVTWVIKTFFAVCLFILASLS